MGSGLEMIIALVFGYLCGTIPFGLILVKSAGLGDIRSIGSGNIGATNVLRTGNKKVAALTLILDALKGTVPAALMGWLYGPEAGVLAPGRPGDLVIWKADDHRTIPYHYGTNLVARVIVGGRPS